MKKQLALTLALVTLLAVGCGKNAEPEPAKNPGAPAPSGSNPSGGSNSGSGSTPTAPSTGGSNNPLLPPAPEKPKFEKVTLGPLKMGDLAKIGPLDVTLVERNVVTKAAGLPPGYAYVVMKLKIKNNGELPYTINTTDHLKFVMPDGKKLNVFPNATAQRSPRLQGTLNQGQETEGWLGYLVKPGPGEFKYYFLNQDWGDAHWIVAVQ